MPEATGGKGNVVGVRRRATRCAGWPCEVVDSKVYDRVAQQSCPTVFGALAPGEVFELVLSSRHSVGSQADLLALMVLVPSFSKAL